MNKELVKKTFTTIRDNFSTDDKAREEIIILSRSILKPAKQAIYALHRNDTTQATTLLDEATKAIMQTAAISKQHNDLDVGAYKAGLEEFLEAYAYYTYITKKEIFVPEMLPDISIPETTYLSALCDFTGELSRRAISLATQQETEQVNELKEVVSFIYELFLSFDFRSSELRKKFEGIKYSLHKIEGILYDLSFKNKGELK